VLTGDPDEASRRAAGEARALLEGLSPSFAVLFTSAHFPPGDLLAHLNGHVPGTVVMGGMASGGRSSSPARMRSASSRVTADGAI
jgi:small ligand-binding sensory domain FIST